MSGPYDDILHLGRPKSAFPSMAREKRAAQFCPFAALTGYDDAVEEAGRFVNKRPDLSEDELKRIDAEVKAILEKDDPLVKFTVFIPDEKKEGGEIASIVSRIKRFREFERLLHLENGAVVPLDNILGAEEIEEEAFVD